MKKKELAAVTDIPAKISELEKAILELHGEGRPDKVKSLRRSIAQLKTRLTSKKNN